MKLISVIVPVYNCENFLEKTIESLLNQTWKNIEIIVINDGSTDNSIQLLKQYKIKYGEKIKLINKNNSGVSNSRNIGLDTAKGEYIVFVDGDDIVDKNFCKTLAENMEKTDSDLSIVNYQIINKQGFVCNKTGTIRLFNDYDKIFGLFEVYQGYLCNKMYKKSIINKFKLRLNEKIYMTEDLLFNYMYMGYAKKVVYDNTKLYGYYIHESNSSKKINMNWFSILETYKYIINHYNNYNDKTQSIIDIKYLFILFEAKCRAELLNIDIESICYNYNFLYSSLTSKLCSESSKTFDISFKDKIKLFLQHRLPQLASIIKKNKLKRGI